MPEGNINAEVAEHLREHGAHDEHARPHQPSKRRIETIEILEAILLAIVAIATALSGYQAALWDGESAKEYATSSRLRSESVEQRTSTANQIAHLQRRHSHGLAAGLRRRGRGAPEGPREPLHSRVQGRLRRLGRDRPHDQPETRRPARATCRSTRTRSLEEAAELNKEASHAFDLGVEYRATGEHYVRVTVILAAVLFLIAIGQRFKVRGVRYSVNIVAGVFLVYALYPLRRSTRTSG